MALAGSGRIYIAAVGSIEYLLTFGPRIRSARFWIELSSEPSRIVGDEMSDRAHRLLLLANKPIEQRESGWIDLVQERDERATLALLRDAFQRGRVTTDDYHTMQLTPTGHGRLRAGEKLIAARRDES